jgi:hypothetical protein
LERFFLDERFRTLASQRKYASLPHYRSFTLDELTAGRKPVLRIRIRIDFGRLNPDPGGQKITTKIEKSEEISCFEVLDDVLF